MKLCIVRQQYRPDGGAERFISRALSELVRQKQFDTSVITRSWQGDQQPEVEVIPCDPVYKGRLQRESTFADEARKLWQQNKFDLVQSHERIAGCDIYRAGDGVHKVWLEQRARIMNPLKNWFNGMSRYHKQVLAAEKALFEDKNLKAVICNSDMVRQEISANFDIDPDKLMLIYNGIDTERFKPCSLEVQKKVRVELGLEDRLTLIYVGSGFERKGLETAIRALAMASVEAQLLVVGKDKKIAKYQQLAQKLNIESRVIFCGMQTDPRPYYHAADALIHPALYDPFPNVIHEGMASGLPIITSTKSGGAEFVKQSGQGFTADALDVVGFARFISDLQDAERLAEMKTASRSFILPYTIENCIQRYIQLYQRLRVE